MAKKKISQKIKQLVRDRSKNHCEYCCHPESFANQFYSIEHIIPVSKGGTHESDNLAYSCQCCNGHKYNKTHALDPVNGQPVQLFHTRIHSWYEHFCWSDDFLKIEGISAVGRVTIQTLGLNRKSLIKLRAILFAFGEHPPTHHSTEQQK